LLACAPHAKARMLLTCAYALGLRVSELCALRVEHIDSAAEPPMSMPAALGLVMRSAAPRGLLRDNPRAAMRTISASVFPSAAFQLAPQGSVLASAPRVSAGRFAGACGRLLR
jgi:hypothetical protein